MADLLRWGKDRVKNAQSIANKTQGAFHQVNPWDNGRTYDTNQRGVAPGTVNPVNIKSNNTPGFQWTNNSLTRGASRTFDQVNPMDNGRSWKTRAPINDNRGAFDQIKQPAIDIGKSIIKAPVQMLNTAGAQLAEIPATVDGMIQTKIQSDLTKELLAAQKRGDKLGYAEAQRKLDIIGQELQKTFAKQEAGHDMFGDKGGLFNMGTFYNAEDSRRGDLKTGVTKIGGGTLQTMATVAPFAKGGSVAVMLGSKPLAAKAALMGAEGLAYGGAYSTGQQLQDNGRVDPRQLIRDTLIGGGVSAAIPLGGAAIRAGARQIAPGATQTISKVANAADNLRPSKMAANHPAVLALDDTLNMLNQQRGKMLAGGMKETHPAVKANDRAFKLATQEKMNTLKGITEGGYVQVPGSYKGPHTLKDVTPISSVSNLDDTIAQVKGKYGLTKFDQRDIANLKKIMADPEADVKVYRSSPKNELNADDWVTTSKTYADDIRRQNGGKVYEHTVKAKELGLPNNIDDNPSLARFSAFKYNKAAESLKNNQAGFIDPGAMARDIKAGATKVVDKGRSLIKNVMDDESGFAKIPGRAKELPENLVESQSKQVLKRSLADSSNNQIPTGPIPGKNQVPGPTPLSKELPKLADNATPLPPSKLNTDTLNVSRKAKKALREAEEGLTEEIQKAKGARLTNKEVREHAKVTRDILSNPKNRAATKDYLAGLQTLREDNAALITKKAAGKLTDSDASRLNEGLLRQHAAAADAGRTLQAFAQKASPEERTVLDVMLKKIAQNTDDLDNAIAAAKKLGANPTAKEQAEFYRTFVKATKEDWLDKYRYTNMLSSPLTHAVNITSNLSGVGGVAPVQKLFEGAVDAGRSVITGGPRKAFASEAGSYYKGAFKAAPEAFNRFKNVMKGLEVTGNPDMDVLRNVPLATKGAAGKADTVLSFIPKLLEASDQFATTLSKGGEKAAFAKKVAKGVKYTAEQVDSMADDAAKYRVFRQELHKQGQGHLLDMIDFIPKQIQEARLSKNPYIRNFSKFTFPFVNTPTNLFKQGIEYSPAGIFTLHGSANKTQQAAKALMGTTMVTSAGAALAANDAITFGEPTDPKQRDAFRAEGKQPYAIKIGNKWIGYSKAHPAIAFNLAMVAAYKDASDKGSVDQSVLDKMAQTGSGVLGFFRDQSYLKSVGDMTSIMQAKDGAKLADVFANQATNTANQLAPFKSMTSWIGRQIDPTQRKVDYDKGTPEQIWQGMVKDIPGLNKNVPARKNPYTGEDLKLENQTFNSFSPLRVTTDKGFGNTTGLNVNQREQQRDLPLEVRKDFRQGIINDKAAAKELANEKETIKKEQEKAGTTDGGSSSYSEVKQYKSNGKYYATIDGETKNFDNKEKAEQAVDVAKFKAGDEKKKEIGNKIYLKADNEQGYTVKSKADYDYDLKDSEYTLALDRAKSNDDVDAWFTTAQQKADALTKLRDSYDPEIEQDKINATQKKIEDLQDQAEKYNEYGGFTKGKGSKTGKKGFQAPNSGGSSVVGDDNRALIKNVATISSKRLRRKF